LRHFEIGRTGIEIGNDFGAAQDVLTGTAHSPQPGKSDRG
jgi:hypothetical protein